LRRADFRFAGRCLLVLAPTGKERRDGVRGSKQISRRKKVIVGSERFGGTSGFSILRVENMADSDVDNRPVENRL
jgi:hypothetical protein